ncbi:MAG: alpha/beta hydrolase [Verrucomicrobium sp.]|nr:alpha/beta hydrolase-fold protein [Verrucomicrobium sp.]
MPAVSPFRTVELSDPAFTGPGLRFATVKSKALGRRADVTLYAPRGYNKRVLPLVILLHGVYGSHWAWAMKGGAHRVLQRLVSNEEVPPMMLAMPSDGLWGDGSGYLTHVEADYATWIVDEVPALAAMVEPLVEDSPCFIAGLSMGGYGALRLGALHPERFKGISAHSSITHYDQKQDFVEESLQDYHLKPGQLMGVADTILANRAKLPPLRFDCGRSDPLLEHNRELHRRLEEEKVPHEYYEYAGGHTWEYWSEHLADSLKFFGKRLA